MRGRLLRLASAGSVLVSGLLFLAGEARAGKATATLNVSCTVVPSASVSVESKVEIASTREGELAAKTISIRASPDVTYRVSVEGGRVRVGSREITDASGFVAVGPSEFTLLTPQAVTTDSETGVVVMTIHY